MKLHTAILPIFGIISLECALAASSVQLEVGEFRTSGNLTVTSGTWILVLNQDANASLPGGLTIGGDNALVDGSPTQDPGAFAGVTLGLNQIIAGDRIVGMGTIGDVDLGDGYTATPVSFSNGQENLAYGIYWFPGLNPNTVVPETFEVGGVFQKTTSPFALRGMVSPADQVAFESATFDVTGFKAVAVPEPATLSLSALGLAALLRRRRS